MESSKLTFTPLRISTLVTTGHLGTNVDLKTLFEQLKDILVPIGYPEEGILKMEHKDQVVGFAARDVLTKRRVSDKTFFNQSTLVIRKRRDDEVGGFKEVNMKLFENGGFQMTGVTSEEFSRNVVLWLIEHLKQLKKPISKEPLRLAKFAIQLLNSDYKMNTLVKRDELHRLLSNRYRLFSTLETTIYQGVNTKYYYNEEAERNPDTLGICQCPRPCTGQGDGKSVGACKRITISVFQTGSIIITGARNRDQLDEAYYYMNAILRKHASEVLKPLPAAAPAEKTV
jgi:TATA-box binding protein (TBP) (component of TFIID and TFIIIB)